MICESDYEFIYDVDVGGILQGSLKEGLIFSTANDNQTQVGVKVYQGEREMAADNKFLGHFDLVGLAPAPRGRAQIEVTFDVDTSGILHVNAKDKATGKDQTMRIETSGGLSKEDIARMQQEAEANVQQDKQKKQVAELRNSADTLIWQSQQQLDEHEDKIDDQLRSDVTEKISKVRELCSSDNINDEELKTAMEELNKSLSQIGEKIYGTEQQSEASESQSVDDDNENKTGNVNENQF